MSGLVKKLLFCGAKSFPPEGHIWVSVGPEKERQQRFELEATILNHPLFHDLLQRSMEEFGYSYMGALRIACETELFLHLLDVLRSSNQHHADHSCCATTSRMWECHNRCLLRCRHHHHKHQS